MKDAKVFMRTVYFQYCEAPNRFLACPEEIVDFLPNWVLIRANVNAELFLWYSASSDAAGVEVKEEFLSSWDFIFINEPFPLWEYFC